MYGPNSVSVGGNVMTIPRPDSPRFPSQTPPASSLLELDRVQISSDSPPVGCASPATLDEVLSPPAHSNSPAPVPVEPPPPYEGSLAAGPQRNSGRFRAMFSLSNSTTAASAVMLGASIYQQNYALFGGGMAMGALREAMYWCSTRHDSAVTSRYTRYARDTFTTWGLRARVTGLIGITIGAATDETHPSLSWVSFSLYGIGWLLDLAAWGQALQGDALED